MSGSIVGPGVVNTCRRPDASAAAGPRVLVFGCARSGTTLMVNLLRTFTGVRVADTEGCVSDLLNDPYPGWLAIKRTAHCAEHLITDLPRLGPHLWIIDIIRDPRDVVTSVLEPFPGYYCGYERWERDLRVSEHLARVHPRYLPVRYEHLVQHPDQVQQDLADVMHLTAHTPFTRFAQVMPPTVPAGVLQALGGVRPVHPGRTGRWQNAAHRARVAAQLAAHPQMETMLQRMGYPPTPEAALCPGGQNNDGRAGLE